MTDAAAAPVEAGYMVYKPTLKDKASRFFGFKFELGKEPEGIENFEGWAKTHVRLHFTILGRLRLLTTGKLKVDLTHYTDAPFETMKTRTDLRIMAPWERD